MRWWLIEWIEVDEMRRRFVIDFFLVLYIFVVLFSFPFTTNATQVQKCGVFGGKDPFLNLTFRCCNL